MDEKLGDVTLEADVHNYYQQNQYDDDDDSDG